ncbi:disabled homolog 1-like [Thunnus albacares]|uniref:disabled homolog 1-like n=1 Tax=Thunnus albacares TaxID=8236 RepID=UPI001CF6D65F|nr:disabled homolog 1-like [Thunnus albacares]
MMDMEQAAGSCPAPDQAAVSTWLSSSTKGATRTPSDVLYRFHGDGVRYKAKLIGVDPVPTAHGEKTCWDSMMKLKGIEATARKQGKHKQRIWLKISFSGLKIIDERTGAVLHDHERSRISSLTKDQSDLRALAYIYQQEDTYTLFYIKMANLADPVMVDIKEVCERVDPETPEDATETQNSVLLVLDESSDHPPEANEHVFSPRPDSPSRQTKQPSSSNELMEIFSIQMEEPLMPSQSVCSIEPESPKQMLSNPQILSMFPTQPVGGSPYSSPPYSPTAMPWGQQGPLRTQRAGPMGAAPWPTMNGGMVAWAATGITALPTGSQIQAHSSQPGVMMGGNTIDYPAAPSAVNGYPTPLNSPYNPPGATATLQSMSPSMEHNPFL